MASSGESGLEAHAAKIRDARECLGWTRQQLAVKCGLTLHAVTRLELADGVRHRHVGVDPHQRVLVQQHVRGIAGDVGEQLERPPVLRQAVGPADDVAGDDVAGDEPDAKLRKPDP